jgi:hypothetical protein
LPPPSHHNTHTLLQYLSPFFNPTLPLVKLLNLFKLMLLAWTSDKFDKTKETPKCSVTNLNDEMLELNLVSLMAIVKPL